MVAPKLCMICKEKIIESWESACGNCWQKLEKREREWMIMLNHVRETLRDCGVDLLELDKVIKW